MAITFEIPDNLFKSAMIVTSIDPNIGVIAKDVPSVSKPCDEGWLPGNFVASVFSAEDELDFTLLDKLQTIISCREFALGQKRNVEFLFNTSNGYHVVFWRVSENFM